MAENTMDYQSEKLIYELRGMLDELEKRKTLLLSEQSKIDLEKTDIEHYIEFGNFSASEGYKAVMILKECLERRRAIKDECNMVRSVADMLGSRIKPERIDNIIKRTDGRSYHPRIRKELFT